MLLDSEGAPQCFSSFRLMQRPEMRSRAELNNGGRVRGSGRRKEEEEVREARGENEKDPQSYL